MHSIPEINFEEISGRDGHLGLITLTRTQVLNALNQAMFNAINQQLTEWEAANHIKAVVIQAAEGRAFCAGGDIRSAYERKMAGDPTLANFFYDEYRLNRHIHHYTKPYIALIDGITMGGGVGISIHASHRVATDRLVFAMPETGIGFYPDVGTTYILARLPHKIGFYLGLSGARLNLSDCVATGMIDYPVKQNIFPEIIYQLADTTFEEDAKASVSQVLQQFYMPINKSNLWEHRVEIENCFSKNTVEDILLSLEQADSQWSHEASAVIKTKSPTSLKVTLQALQEAQKMDFDNCIQIEYRLTSRFIEGHDFFEGIRAVVIDKDQKPIWQPPRLQDVKAIDVKEYFAPLEVELIDDRS
jgi:enoyl-CoA hydratase